MPSTLPSAQIKSDNLKFVLCQYYYVLLYYIDSARLIHSINTCTVDFAMDVCHTLSRVQKCEAFKATSFQISSFLQGTNTGDDATTN